MEEVFFSPALKRIADFPIIIDVAIFLAITIVLFNLLDYFVAKLKKSWEAKELHALQYIPAINKIAKGLILFFVVTAFLQSHGYSLQALIAGFGITGLAVGFAAKETISGIFGALAMLADKSFQIGDYVILGSISTNNVVEGRVEDINMRSTKLRSNDGSIIIVPNNVMVNAIIKNHGN